VHQANSNEMTGQPQDERLARVFEENRGHLRTVAYSMLGSINEAEDAVHESWLRLGRSGIVNTHNLPDWLTTVVASVCVDVLRARRSRRESSLEKELPSARVQPNRAPDPEQEAVLADSVGLALLVVLDRLGPAERIAFVLHDMFALPFDEIGIIIGRSPMAAMQLASRARRRIEGGHPALKAPLRQQQQLVERFVTALRHGDLQGLLKMLEPELVVTVDAASGPTGEPQEIHGAEEWVEHATAFIQAARFTRPVLINGAVGAIWAPRGRLVRALRFTLKNSKIARIDIVADQNHLRFLELKVIDGLSSIAESDSVGPLIR
jgi:RNA polymerase sigma factor (sigma-70 family)